jgi:hypothetical protein
MFVYRLIEAAEDGNEEAARAAIQVKRFCLEMPELNEISVPIFLTPYWL